MKLLNELTLKNIRLNKKKSVATIIGICLSVALMFTVLTMLFSVRKTVEDIVKDMSGKYHLVNILGEEYQDKLEANVDVDELLVNKILGYSKINSKNEYMPYIRVIATSKAGLADNNLKLISGRLPENSNEIVLSKELINNYKDDLEELKAGKTINLDLGNRRLSQEDISQIDTQDLKKLELLEQIQLKRVYNETEHIEDVKTKTFKIVGIIQRPNTMTESFSEPGYSAFTLDSPELGDMVRNTELLYSLKDPKNIDAHIKNTYKNASLEPSLFLEKNNDLLAISGSGLKFNQYRSIVIIASVVLGIIIITSISIIKNSFSILIVEKTKQYGILKSLGATDKQVKKNILFEGFVLGGIGFGLGVLLGIIASFILSKVVDVLTMDALGAEAADVSFAFVLSWQAIAITLVLTVITIYLSTILIARRSIKLSPIEAIRSVKDVKLNAKTVRTSKLTDKLLGVSGSIAKKNIKRNKKKYRATVISLALSVAVFIVINYFVNSIIYGVNTFEGETNYNLSHYAGAHKTDPELDEKKLYQEDLDVTKRIINEVLENEKYAIYEISDWVISSKYLNEDFKKRIGITIDTNVNVKVHEVNPESFDKLLGENKFGGNVDFVFTNRAQYKTEDNKILMCDQLSESKVKIAQNNNPNLISEKEIELYKVDKLLPGMDAYTKGSTIDIYTRKGSLGDNVEYSYYIFAIDTDNNEQTFDSINKFLSENNINDYRIDNIGAREKMINNLLLLIQIFAYGFMIVMTLIALTNVFNAISSNVYSRQTEFASLISLGMSSKQMNLMSFYESLILGIKALFWGILIGLLANYLIYIGMKSSIEAMTYQIPWIALLVSILTTFIIIFLIMKYSVGKIKSQNIIATIRNENI
ncbi:ABC transporter permease [Fastidiosipila sanguinis]|uniref:ABC3 transporter permease C-terminal domain-containing protein n=1 Tax=Fastidiosipila sanguinis TaxID=236753 RepID=A0A2S0KM20_9FIRM|nr:FtsX-like permease family protein [Fastidiosipila sanguinis]AVM42054.1 hypothetical protein C5Q98_01875 [Fastidiosipila sanguinis]